MSIHFDTPPGTKVWVTAYDYVYEGEILYVTKNGEFSDVAIRTESGVCIEEADSVYLSRKEANLAMAEKAYTTAKKEMVKYLKFMEQVTDEEVV